jgi:DnaJ-class molecular chaperone
MPLNDRQIAEKDRCSTCHGSGWTWWSAGAQAEAQPPEAGRWVVCRACIGTGRIDQKGRKRQKPDEAPGD